MRQLAAGSIQVKFAISPPDIFFGQVNWNSVVSLRRLSDTGQNNAKR
jgi:hypothetical protein